MTSRNMAFAYIYESHRAYEKKSEKNNNARRVRSEYFLVNFRIVKKPLSFIGKSRTTSDELKK